MGFTQDQIQLVLDRLEFSKDRITSKEDFENGCHHQTKELITDYHISNYIRVYKNIKVDGQHIQMEGYKTGQVQTWRIPDNFQHLRDEKILRKLLEKRFDWFKRFKWSIYSIRDLESYEIYLKTEEGTLYVPIQAILNKDFSIIENRMKTYFGWYDANRTEEQKEKSLKPLNSKTAKKLKRYFKKE